ncbi:MAG: hypothetical protein ACRD43_13095 [Pyrinomonadaceae bacterium]
MSGHTDRAEEGFAGAEGRFQGAFNAAMRAGSFDQSTVTEMIAGLQRQAQGFLQLSSAGSRN